MPVLVIEDHEGFTVGTSRGTTSYEAVEKSDRAACGWYDTVIFRVVKGSAFHVIKATICMCILMNHSLLEHPDEVFG